VAADPVIQIDSKLSSTTAARRGDFELKPFIGSSNVRGAWQLANTLVPYGLLWWAAVWSLQHGSWLLAPVIALMVLFLARCFSLMHDCGHDTLFSHRTTNRCVGFALGIIAAIPQLPWSRGHLFHHRHNGNWERYKGPSALVSVADYNTFSGTKQRLYRVLRHPAMLIPGGFFYLVIKPRVELLAGLAALTPHIANSLRESGFKNWSTVLAGHKSRWWHSPEEFRDLLFNNIAVIGGWIILSQWLGAATFWSIYAPVMACGAAVFICIFFVQHNFPGSYAHASADWSALRGNLEGTSDLELPGLLNWFSADIGCHAIHHLCAAIPNYNLRSCQQRNAHLLNQVTRLRLQDIPSCFDYILWDEDAGRLTTVAAQQPPVMACMDRWR